MVVPEYSHFPSWKILGPPEVLYHRRDPGIDTVSPGAKIERKELFNIFRIAIFGESQTLLPPVTLRNARPRPPPPPPALRNMVTAPTCSSQNFSLKFSFSFFILVLMISKLF